MENSPYRAPEAELTREAPATTGLRLYRESGVLIATVLGGFAAGGLLLGINGQRLGHPNAMMRYFGGALVATLVVVIAGLMLPESIPSALFIVPQVLGILAVLRHTQGAELTRHADNIGAFESNWKAFGISIVVVIVLFALVMAGLLAWDSLFGLPV